MTAFQTAKGLAFVFLSAVYVFAIGVRLAQRGPAGNDRASGGGRRPAGAWVPVVVFAALSLALGGTGLLLHSQSADAERSHALASLSISADTKAARIGAWLDDLKTDARFLATDVGEAEGPRPAEGRRARRGARGVPARAGALPAGLPGPVRRRPRRRGRSVRAVGWP